MFWSRMYGRQSFEPVSFLVRIIVLQENGQTDRRTDRQT